MEQVLLQCFRQLLATQTGLQIREQESEVFARTLELRTRILQLSEPDEYYELLKLTTAQSNAEWKHLIGLLTNQESYFFRDKGQFTLLKERILPELIQANTRRRTLRLWSAGCSTGEEAYSLAMLVDQLLPQRDKWNILILGTDLKEAALEKARLGVYSPWSFRLVETELQQHYFRGQKEGYKLDARVRDMVTFRPGNLFKDTFPNAATDCSEMDLILCRNVFIYFEESAVRTVFHKFAATLRDGGYLMTGHAELNTPGVPVLQARVLPGSVVYQRTAKPPIARPVQRIVSIEQNSALRSLPPTISAPPVVPEVGVRRSEVPASQKEITAPDMAALCLAAQEAANLGRHQEAAQFCRQAIAIDSFAPLPYSLLARIAEEQGDNEEARRLLKKVIYLSPSFIPAYLELADLHEQEGDAARAQKMRATALELLQALTPQAIVEPYGLGAREIIRQLQGASVG